MYVLHHADRPGLYNALPTEPGISPMVSLWKGVTKPIATMAVGLVALGSLFHYVMKGPNEVSKEMEKAAEEESEA
jgi:formate dehydrogenase iron-sulfur subunit